MHRARTFVLTLVAGAALVATLAHVDSHAKPRPLAEPAHDSNTSTLAPTPGGNEDLRRLDQQIAALRSEFHAALDPLEAQVKALREKYEPQIASLVEQRKALVEQSKSPGIQELDRQEAAELASLADREKSEIEQVRQRFADERKEIERKYAERRKDTRASH